MVSVPAAFGPMIAFLSVIDAECSIMMEQDMMGLCAL
jgi:hypothetical protein